MLLVVAVVVVVVADAVVLEHGEDVGRVDAEAWTASLKVKDSGDTFPVWNANCQCGPQLVGKHEVGSLSADLGSVVALQKWSNQKASPDGGCPLDEGPLHVEAPGSNAVLVEIQTPSGGALVAGAADYEEEEDDEQAESAAAAAAENDVAFDTVSGDDDCGEGYGPHCFLRSGGSGAGGCQALAHGSPLGACTGLVECPPPPGNVFCKLCYVGDQGLHRGALLVHEALS